MFSVVGGLVFNVAIVSPTFSVVQTWGGRATLQYIHDAITSEHHRFKHYYDGKAHLEPLWPCVDRSSEASDPTYRSLTYGT
jgi:hypothetical protein